MNMQELGSAAFAAAADKMLGQAAMHELIQQRLAREAAVAPQMGAAAMPSVEMQPTQPQ
jgi:hypothetical protein